MLSRALFLFPDEKYISINSYAAANDDEIGFERGVVLTVLEKKLDGWWRVQYQGKTGWTPGSYLKRMDIQEYEPSGLLKGIVDDSVINEGGKTASKAKAKKDKDKAKVAEAEVAEVKLRPKDAAKPPPRRESISRVNSIHGDKGAFAKIIAARVREPGPSRKGGIERGAVEEWRGGGKGGNGDAGDSECRARRPTRRASHPSPSADGAADEQHPSRP